MPSWFMPMPSDTEMVVNSRGVPPAVSTPSLAASTCGPCVMLQGVVSPFWLTTPIIGLAMAASSSPIARMKARCGVRSRPSVVMRERRGISAFRGGSARGPAAIQGDADLAGKRLGGERFGQEVDIGVEPPVMDDGIAGIAGDVQHLHAGTKPLDLLRELASVHAVRQHHVGEQQVDLRRAFDRLQ